jgi:sugar phosphate isomerase/epimerase
VWLAGHTYAFRALPLEAALDRLVELGLVDVELWLGHAREGISPAVETARRAGVRVHAISAGGFYAADDDTPDRAFELAKALGAGVIVTCVSPSLGGTLARRVSPPIRVAVENHWDQPLATARDVERVIGSSSLGACLDTGHALAAGERPHDFALRMGSRLTHVHLKEGRLPTVPERVLGRRLRRRFFGKASPVRPGEGDLDLDALRGALERVGYEGCVSVEHEGDRPEKALAELVASWRRTD